MSALVNHERCVGCELCARACTATRALSLDLGHSWIQVDQNLCWDCRACERICPFGAIMVPAGLQPDTARRDAARKAASHPEAQGEPVAAAPSGGPSARGSAGAGRPVSTA